MSFNNQSKRGWARGSTTSFAYVPKEPTSSSSKKPSTDDSLQLPNCIQYFPDFYTKEEADEIFEALKKEDYEQGEIAYENSNSNELAYSKSTRLLGWYAENPDWTYVPTAQHVKGLRARPFNPTLLAVKKRIEEVTMGDYTGDSIATL
jgi:hypothetical protein